MTIQEAANLLYEKIKDKAWYVAVGIGKTSEGDACLVMYVKDLLSPELKKYQDVWEDFPLKIEEMDIPSVGPYCF